MIWPTIEELLSLHKKMIAKTGGTTGVRDIGLLESAVNAPLAGFGGVDAFPTVPEKAARLCFGIVSNHPFMDGNKRIGAAAMLYVLRANHYPFSPSHATLISMIRKIAAENKTEQEFSAWVLDCIFIEQ